MDFIKKHESILALVLLVSFFIPWFSVFFASITGMAIATNGGARELILFAIPAACLVVLFLAHQDKSTKAAALICGLIPLGFFLYAWLDLPPELSQVQAESEISIFSFLAVGFYSTVASAVGLVLCGLGVIGSN